jgi:hypothetical protein
MKTTILNFDTVSASIVLLSTVVIIVAAIVYNAVTITIAKLIVKFKPE